MDVTPCNTAYLSSHYNEDSCVSAGCCWFLAPGRPSCYQKQEKERVFDFPDQKYKSPYYESSIVEPIEFGDYEQYMAETEVNYSWSNWSNQPCAAPCNAVGVQVQQRKCIGRSILGVITAPKGRCNGSDKNALLCIGTYTIQSMTSNCYTFFKKKKLQKNQKPFWDYNKTKMEKSVTIWSVTI